MSVMSAGESEQGSMSERFRSLVQLNESIKDVLALSYGLNTMSINAIVVVNDFDTHIKAAEGFHRRWMGSNEAKNDWCERASQLQIDMLCPQHGSVYQGKDVERFINWFADLKVGVLKHNGAS